MHDFLDAILQSTKVREIFESKQIEFEAKCLKIYATSEFLEFPEFKIPQPTPENNDVYFHPIENKSETIFGNCPNCRNNICLNCRNNGRIIKFLCKRFDEICGSAFLIQNTEEPESLSEIYQEICRNEVLDNVDLPMNKYEFLGQDRDLIIADAIKCLERNWIRRVLDACNVQKSKIKKKNKKKKKDGISLESSHVNVVDEALGSGPNLHERHEQRQLEELSMKSTSTACDGNEVKSSDIGSEAEDITIEHLAPSDSNDSDTGSLDIDSNISLFKKKFANCRNCRNNSCQNCRSNLIKIVGTPFEEKFRLDFLENPQRFLKNPLSETYEKNNIENETPVNNRSDIQMLNDVEPKFDGSSNNGYEQVRLIEDHYSRSHFNFLQNFKCDMNIIFAFLGNQ